MSEQLSVDVVVIGGGIAGLWLNARLHQLGYSSILIENNSLGGGQTIKSQGIIHGGTKYALTGKLTGASEAIAGMPKLWRSCLAGEGELDLTKANVLSQHHYLWSPGSLAGNLVSFFASKALRARVQQVKGDKLPIALQNSQFKGRAYQLEELVFDIKSVIESLAQLSADTLLHATQVKPIESTEHSITLQADAFTIKTKKIIFSAGEGNSLLMQHFNLTKPKAQLRPLHMVFAKSPQLKPLYAHCLGAGVKPRVTITTHYHKDGDPVWYMGGNLSEADGVARTEAEQIAFAKKELANIIPWIDVSDAKWATLRVDRAEPAQNNLLRPDNAFISKQQAIIVGWPTKLALAPNFTEQCIDVLVKEHITPSGTQSFPLLPKPVITNNPWDDLF